MAGLDVGVGGRVEDELDLMTGGVTVGDAAAAVSEPVGVAPGVVTWPGGCETVSVVEAAEAAAASTSVSRTARTCMVACGVSGEVGLGSWFLAGENECVKGGRVGRNWSELAGGLEMGTTGDSIFMLRGSGGERGGGAEFVRAEGGRDNCGSVQENKITKGRSIACPQFRSACRSEKSAHIARCCM